MLLPGLPLLADVHGGDVGGDGARGVGVREVAMEPSYVTTFNAGLWFVFVLVHIGILYHLTYGLAEKIRRLEAAAANQVRASITDGKTI
jgi:hypothetical protein